MDDQRMIIRRTLDENSDEQLMLRKYENCRILEGHWSGVNEVIELHGSYSGLLCSVSKDKTIRIWLDPLKVGIPFHPEKILRGHLGSVNTVVQLLDDRLCTGSSDGTIRIWDPIKHWTVGPCDKTLRSHSKAVNKIALLKNGIEIVSVSDDCTLKVWSLLTYQNLYTLKQHSDPVVCVVELSTGKLCTTSLDATLVLWSKGLETTTSTTGSLAGGMSSKFGAGGRVNINDRRSVGSSSSKGGAPVASSSFKSTEGGGFTIGSTKMRKVIDLGVIEEYKVETSFITKGHKGPVLGVAELPDGHLCSCSADKTLKVWDMTSYVCVLTMEGHWTAVNWLIVLSSGRICSCSNDLSIKLWDVNSFIKKNLSTPDDHCIKTLVGHTAPVRRVFETSQGQLLSCGEDDTVRIWG
jgi:WD40 repeat protein